MADGAIRSSWASDFAAAAFDPGRSVPEWLRDPLGTVADRRFAIYRNNVAVGLIEALAANFPVLERLLGPDAFRQTAREFIRARPPRTRVLHEYGEEFDLFLGSFEPLRGLPYLPDVARLERAFLDAFHAGDADVLEGSALASIAPDALASLRLPAHPAARLVRSSYPVATIWEANRPGREPEPIDGSRGEIALLTRPRDAVELRALRPADGVLVEALMGGATLMEASCAAAARAPDFDLSAALQIVVRAGAFQLTGTDRPDGRQGEIST